MAAPLTPPTLEAQGVDTLPEKVVGFSLGPIAQQQRSSGVELARINRIGANTVSLSVWWDFNEETSTLRRGQMTNPDSEVRLAVQAVRARGMSAAILPLFLCSTCKSNWRGAVEPSSKDLFYASYRDMIANYAEIAEQEGASLLFIGSEMSSMQGDTAEWRGIAETARSKYSGAIAYDVNWDAIDGVRFWDAVDVPSISAYFPLSDKRQPTIDTLKKAWYSGQQELWFGKNSVAEVKKLASRTGKSVLFGEVGYRSRDWGTKYPFDYNADEGGPNPALQADAYQALIETFDGQPWWRGALWWEWEFTGPRPDEDQTFTPRGKAAEDVIRAWYVEGVRPTAENPRLADRSAQLGGGGGRANAPGSGTREATNGASRSPGGEPDRGRSAPGGAPAAPQGGDSDAPRAPGDATPGGGEGEQAAAPTTDSTGNDPKPTTVAAVILAALLLLGVLGALARRTG